MQETYYLGKLYPFQDKILHIIEWLDLDFYLTGGTALGRCHLNHRYSDDLDFFVNSFDDFKKQCNTAIKEFKKRWACDVAATSDTFVRIFLQREEVNLKVDFVNDVPFHFGDIQQSPIFHRVDSWRNILSNKLLLSVFSRLPRSIHTSEEHSEFNRGGKIIPASLCPRA